MLNGALTNLQQNATSEEYLEDAITHNINTWLPNDNTSKIVNLVCRGSAYQLLCNKINANNWNCLVNGNNGITWKIEFVNGTRIVWELATKSDLTDYKTITINDSDYNFFINVLDNLQKSKTIESYLISVESTGTLQNHKLADGSLLVIINEINNKSMYITTGDGYIYNYSYHHGYRYISLINQSVYLQ